MPGEYTVRLTAGKFSASQSVTVKMDPRVKAPTSALVQQHSLATQITSLLREDFDAVTQIRALSDPLKKRADTVALGEGLLQLNEKLSQLLDLIDSADAAPTSQAAAAVAELQKSTDALLTQWHGLQNRSRQ